MTDTNSNTNNSNNNNNNNIANRQSESPARTIDSHDSTTGSLDTIVDRNLKTAEQMLQQTLAHSVNTTNEQLQHDSLTNSQISMIQRSSSNNNSGAGSDDDQQQRQRHQQPMEQQQQLDAQSHIYSSPVYAVSPDQKPPLKLTAATLLDSVVSVDDIKKPKLISHEEFQQQLQAAAASRANTLDSRISKKQRFPPEFLKIKDGDQEYVSKQQQLRHKDPKLVRHKLAKRTGPPFPVQIALGTVQLVLSISLVALGSLLLVREASLSTAGSGIWTGLVAAITGSMGVVSMRKTQNAFLALSLVCIATSTLALAISGVGLSRDINRMEEKFDLMNANDEISAASGLIFTLFLHFLVSIVSVYRCALNMCERSQESELNDVIIKANNSGIALDQDKIDQYIKAMSLTGSEKENTEKLAAMWMYATQMRSLPARKMRLIPASTGGSSIMSAPPPATAMMMSPPIPPMPYRGMTLPYMRPPPGPLIYAPHPISNSMHGTYRTHKNNNSADINSQRRRRRAAAAGAIVASQHGKIDVNRRQRRKSEADVIDGQAFTYTGLDRAMADSFLARQEQSNTGSHMEYSSSSSVASDFGGRQPTSHASSKTKIVCRDVKM